MRVMGVVLGIAACLGCHSTCEDLQTAAMSGDVATIDRLAGDGLDVGCTTGQRWQAIHYAARAGQTSAIDHLLTHGARLEVYGEIGRTPLYEAAKYGHTDTALWLLEHGAEVDSASETRMTPLFVASEYRRTPVMELLLDHGADVNAADTNGTTPLMQLIQHAPLEADQEAATCAGVLIDHDAWMDVHQTGGWTPLHQSADHGLVAVTTLLIDRGANPSPFRPTATLPRPRVGFREEEIRAQVEGRSLWWPLEIAVPAGPSVPISWTATVVFRAGGHGPDVGAPCDVTLEGAHSGGLTCHLDARCSGEILYSAFGRCEQRDGAWRGADPFLVSEDGDPSFLLDVGRHVLVVDDGRQAPTGRSIRLRIDDPPSEHPEDASPAGG